LADETLRVWPVKSYLIVYRSNLNTRQAIEELEKGYPGVVEIRELINFIETSERGIVR
jgi:acyl-[acyl carrier protein]--UDP-N-acetylglucosamine O-acyltransferase